MVKGTRVDVRVRRIVGVAGLLLASVASGEAQPFYANDFAVRTSAGPVQTGRWYELGYAPDKRLAKNLGSGIYNPDLPYSSGNLADSQDNWRMVTSGESLTFGVYCRDDAGNQFGEFLSSSATAQKRTGIVHPFYNSITDGVLRVQGDLRVPSKWGSTTAYLRLQPVARKHLTNMDWSQTGSLFNFGLQANSKSNETTTIFYYSTVAGGGSAQVARSSVVAAGHWCRVRGEVNLATGKLTFYWADLGTAHPTLETEATLATKSGSYYLYTPMSEANGPIQGLAVVMSGISNSDTIAFDNLVCEWQKPGSETFVRFYENDFNVRRYRTVVPEGSTAYAYSVTTSSWTRTCSSYAIGKPIIADPHGSSETVQQLGMDGWRRCNQVGGGFIRPVAADTGDAGGVKLAVTHDSSVFANASQTLGMKCEGGTLKGTCDFRLPDQWYRSSTDQLFFIIGGDLLYTGSNATRTGDYYACRIGAMMPASNDKKKFEAAWSNGSDKSVRGSALVSNTWYRVTVNLDLDARTYGFKLYQFGETSRSSTYEPTDEELVCEQTNLAFAPGFTGPVSSFSLWTYGAGTTAPGTVYWDSVKFWRNGSATAFYEFTGQQSTRRLNLVRGGIMGSVPQVDNGQDHWIRRHCGTSPMFVTAGENPALAGEAPEYFAVGVQALGSSIPHGRLRVQADIRPPRYWTWESSGAARIHLGGDTYLQGVSGTNDVNRLLCIYAHALHFGFGRPTKTQDVCGNMNDVKIGYLVRTEGELSGSVSYCDAAIARDHWYRFRATLDLDRKTYDLAVFDLGVAHPDPTTRLTQAERVASVRGVPFTCVDEAISSLGVSTYGVATIDPSDPDDPGLAFFDNIVVTRPEGLVILVR
ncbi:MAG: hypothetical protein ACI4RD_10030 [Kiritimatiellia bacterium]